MPRTKNKVCWKAELEYPISLIQQGIDKFTVVYGEQINKDLPYGGAAARLGEAIMHALACQGKLDNREKGER